MEYIFSLPFLEGMKLLHLAHEKDEHELLYRRWIIGGYDKSMSFDKFEYELKKSSGVKDTTTDAEEIFNKVESILNLER